MCTASEQGRSTTNANSDLPHSDGDLDFIPPLSRQETQGQDAHSISDLPSESPCISQNPDGALSLEKEQSLAERWVGDALVAVVMALAMVGLLYVNQLGIFAPHTEMPSWVSSGTLPPADLKLSFNNLGLFLSGILALLFGFVQIIRTAGRGGGLVFLLALLLAILTSGESAREARLAIEATFAAVVSQTQGCGGVGLTR